MDRTNAIRILKLQTNFTADDVKKSFKSLALSHHLDKNGNANKFRLIMEAKNALIDSKGNLKTVDVRSVIMDELLKDINKDLQKWKKLMYEEELKSSINNIYAISIFLAISVGVIINTAIPWIFGLSGGFSLLLKLDWIIFYFYWKKKLLKFGTKIYGKEFLKYGYFKKFKNYQG